MPSTTSHCLAFRSLRLLIFVWSGKARDVLVAQPGQREQRATFLSIFRLMDGRNGGGGIGSTMVQSNAASNQFNGTSEGRKSNGSVDKDQTLEANSSLRKGIEKVWPSGDDSEGSI